MLNTEKTYQFVSLPKIYNYLNGNEWKLFTVLFDEWQMMKNNDGWYFRSYKDLCNEAGISDKTLTKCLNSLRLKKFISIQTHAHSTQQASEYKINTEFISAFIPTVKNTVAYRKNSDTSKEGKTKEEKYNNSNNLNSDMTTGLEKQVERNVNLREVEEVDDVPFEFGIGEVLTISDGENNAVNSTDNISIEKETISEGTASESENIISEEVKETEPVKTISGVEVRNNPTAPNRIAISKAIELLPTFTKRIRDFKENCTVERQRAEKAIKFIADNRSCATAKQIEVLDKMIAEYKKATSDRDRCIGSDLAEVERQEANTIDCSKPTPSINTASVDYLISIGKRVTWKYDDMVEEAEKVAANTNLTGDELEKYVDNWIYYHTSAVAENVSKIYNNIMKQRISNLRATGAQNVDAA